MTGISPTELRPDLFSSNDGERQLTRSVDGSDARLFVEARALGLDPDAIAAKALADAVRAEKERRWQEENREAYESQNAWVEKHGLPLAKYRMF